MAGLLGRLVRNSLAGLSLDSVGRAEMGGGGVDTAKTLPLIYTFVNTRAMLLRPRQASRDADVRAAFAVL